MSGTFYVLVFFPEALARFIKIVSMFSCEPLARISPPPPALGQSIIQPRGSGARAKACHANFRLAGRCARDDQLRENRNGDARRGWQHSQEIFLLARSKCRVAQIPLLVFQVTSVLRPSPCSRS